MAEQGFRVTYATMNADNEELHKGYDEGIEKAKKWLGQRHTFFVNGEAREGESGFEERSPGDHDLAIGTFAQAGRQDVKDAIGAAGAFFPEWSSDWRRRVDLQRRAADIISEERFELS